MKKLIFCAMIIGLMASCSHKWGSVYTPSDRNLPSEKIVGNSPSSAPSEDRRVAVAPTGFRPVDMIPNATAFRMSGDYQNNVAVTLNSNGQLTYFPAPSDITADSEPISLGNGWWLNNQGLGQNSVFTKYTFAEYAALPSAPSTQQLILDILPGAKVTEFIELPMKITEVSQNLEAAKEYVKSL